MLTLYFVEDVAVHSRLCSSFGGIFWTW